MLICLAMFILGAVVFLFGMAVGCLASRFCGVCAERLIGDAKMKDRARVKLEDDNLKGSKGDTRQAPDCCLRPR